jgi:uncharacterized caspase-like protein
LQAAGFDVSGARDLDGDMLRRAFRDFIDKARQAGPDSVAMVYFSGYGLQFEGENYVVPKLQADQIVDYKTKLSGASPDEAKARLDALETIVADLSPRLLSEEQSRKLISILSTDPGRAIITL